MLLVSKVIAVPKKGSPKWRKTKYRVNLLQNYIMLLIIV